jgi:dynein heavy chain
MSVLKRFLDEQEQIPWDALLYVTGHINYGGRVTDDWDRRCLLSVLGIFYNKDILTDEYAFSNSGVYFAPKFGKMADYKE